MKGVIFDIGGVIHQPFPETIYFEKSKEIWGLAESYLNRWKELMVDFGQGKIDEQRFWEIVKNENRMDFILPETSIFVSEYVKNLKINKKLIEIISKLKKQGLIIGLLSNTIEPHMKYFKSLDFFPIFDNYTFSYKVGVNKPDIKIYQAAIEKMGLDPREIVYVDDLEANLIPAQKLQMKTIHFKGNRSLKINGGSYWKMV